MNKNGAKCRCDALFYSKVSEVGAVLSAFRRAVNCSTAGLVYAPLRGTNDENGNWIIEGHGVDLDIVVENDPKSMTEGKAPQLERGIEEVLKLMDAEPKKWLSRPSDPVKTK